MANFDVIRSVIKFYQDRGAEDTFDGMISRTVSNCGAQSIGLVTPRRFDPINRVRYLNALRVRPVNRIERLRGDRQHQ